MKGDMVKVKLKIIDDYRKSHAMSKAEFYRFVGVHFLTGSKLFRGDAVCLAIARKVSSAIGIEATRLIESWE